MIFNEIKCHVNTCLGLVGGMHHLHHPVSAHGHQSSRSEPTDTKQERHSSTEKLRVTALVRIAFASIFPITIDI